VTELKNKNIPNPEFDPEQTRRALEQSIERVNAVIMTLEEAQKTSEEVFEWVVSV